MICVCEQGEVGRVQHAPETQEGLHTRADLDILSWGGCTMANPEI